LDVTHTLEIQPIQPNIASKWQSSISPASKSFSPKSKCTKIKVLSKDVEIVTEKHVCIVGENNAPRKEVATTAMMWKSDTDDATNVVGLLDMQQYAEYNLSVSGKNYFYLAKQTL